jgi:hypothetical protein
MNGIEIELKFFYTHTNKQVHRKLVVVLMTTDEHDSEPKRFLINTNN